MKTKLSKLGFGIIALGSMLVLQGCYDKGNVGNAWLPAEFQIFLPGGGVIVGGGGSSNSSGIPTAGGAAGASVRAAVGTASGGGYSP
jgi:hypothetical protein